MLSGGRTLHLSGRNRACAAAQSVETAKAALADAPNVTVVPVPINDGWARDWGPSVRRLCFLALLQALQWPPDMDRNRAASAVLWPAWKRLSSGKRL